MRARTNAHTQSPHANVELQKNQRARARTVPLKPKIRPLQTWPSEQSASLEAVPAHGSSTARGQRGADGSGSVLCQESLRAAWPSSNPPATAEGGRGDLKREVLKPPRRAIHQPNLPPPLKTVLRMNPRGEGFPVRAVSLLQPPQKTRAAAVKKRCHAELRLHGQATRGGVCVWGCGCVLALPNTTTNSTRKQKYLLKKKLTSAK